MSNTTAHNADDSHDAAPETRLLALKLAGLAGVDPRTAAKALREGPRAVRGLAGERCAEAMRAHGIAKTG